MPKLPIHNAPLMTDAADELFKAEQLYQRRKREYEAKLAPLKARVEELERPLLELMLAAGQEALSTKRTTVAVRRTTFAELYDDKKFFEYVGKTKAWELVRKQPVISACRDRWEDEIEIPGVRPGTKVELSINPRKRA